MTIRQNVHELVESAGDLIFEIEIDDGRPNSVFVSYYLKTQGPAVDKERRELKYPNEF